MISKNFDKTEEYFPLLILAIKNELLYNYCIRTKFLLKEIKTVVVGCSRA